MVIFTYELGLLKNKDQSVLVVDQVLEKIFYIFNHIMMR